MPTPSTTAGTTMGSRKSVRIEPRKKRRRLRRPSDAAVPSAVASNVVPVPMIRLLKIARRQASAKKSSSNQRRDHDGIG
ncbi:hypothetical protein D9M70_618830 [compost metagenome]